MAANLQPWHPSALATPYMGRARMGGTRRRRVEPTDGWEQLKLLCRWPEQLAYEEIRPTVLFGSSVRDRAEETGSSERMLYRKAARFDREGIDSLFDSAGAKRRELPPVVRRMIVELKAEYPASASARWPPSATSVSAGGPASTPSNGSSLRSRCH